ncbi:hypothetical protein [Methanofollis ethanolicus]|uniref:hypothetical protein n=1 Tax=Methanofollis ethanolicus TaxID=488124 RepID=UPI0013652E7A|nr:hypothetical protein [Methanofollis ethanolicus]
MAPPKEICTTSLWYPGNDTTVETNETGERQWIGAVGKIDASPVKGINAMKGT